MAAIEELRKKRETKEAKPEDMPLIFEALAEFAAQDSEVQEVISTTDDMKINFKIRDTDIAANMVIEGGKLSAGKGEVADADAVVEMIADVATKMVIGETEALREAYMSGDVTIEGDMSKLMALRPIMDIVREKTGIGEQ